MATNKGSLEKTAITWNGMGEWVSEEGKRSGIEVRTMVNDTGWCRHEGEGEEDQEEKPRWEGKIMKDHDDQRGERCKTGELKQSDQVDKPREAEFSPNTKEQESQNHTYREADNPVHMHQKNKNNSGHEITTTYTNVAPPNAHCQATEPINTLDTSTTNDASEPGPPTSTTQTTTTRTVDSAVAPTISINSIGGHHLPNNTLGYAIQSKSVDTTPHHPTTNTSKQPSGFKSTCTTPLKMNTAWTAFIYIRYKPAQALLLCSHVT